MLVCAVDGWPLAADDSLEERRYYAQNWRSDVAAVLTESGRQVEQIRYGAYGLPWGLPAGDLNADGDNDAGDLSAANTLITASQYDVRADINLDGVLNTSDTAIYPAFTLGRGVISSLANNNRKGYAGYELTGGSIADIWHVRHRVMHTGLGRWIQRDPAGYVDGASLVQYARSMTIVSVDPTGLQATASFCGDGLFCYNLWGSLTNRAATDLAACTAANGVPSMVNWTIPANAAVCAAGCIVSTIAYPVCVLICLGLTETGQGLIAIWGQSNCLAAFRDASNAANVAYCACLAKRARVCLPSSRGEDGYRGVNCTGSGVIQPPNAPIWPDGPSDKTPGEPLLNRSFRLGLDGRL